MDVSAGHPLPGRLLRAAAQDLHRHLPLLALLPMPKYTGPVPDSLPSQALGWGWAGLGMAQCDPLLVMLAVLASYSVSAKAQISRALCASYSGLLTSYSGGSLGNAQLGKWY